VSDQQDRSSANPRYHGLPQRALLAPLGPKAGPLPLSKGTPSVPGRSLE